MTLRLLFVLGLVGCLSQTPKPCSPDELLAIQKDFLLSVKTFCEKGKPLETCERYEVIRAERDARVTRWVACSQ